MARQLENRFFSYSRYTKPADMEAAMQKYKEMWELKYIRKCIFKQLRDKKGVRIIVEEA